MLLALALAIPASNMLVQGNRQNLATPICHNGNNQVVDWNSVVRHMTSPRHDDYLCECSVAQGCIDDPGCDTTQQCLANAGCLLVD